MKLLKQDTPTATVTTDEMQPSRVDVLQAQIMRLRAERARVAEQLTTAEDAAGRAVELLAMGNADAPNATELDVRASALRSTGARLDAAIVATEERLAGARQAEKEAELLEQALVLAKQAGEVHGTYMTTMLETLQAFDEGMKAVVEMEWQSLLVRNQLAGLAQSCPAVRTALCSDPEYAGARGMVLSSRVFGFEESGNPFQKFYESPAWNHANQYRNWLWRVRQNSN